jgi:nitrogen regulatory protein PII
MQRIEATLRPDDLDEIMKAVLNLRVPCHITANEVRYADERVHHGCQYRAVSYEVRWETRARLEVVVADREAKSVIELLSAALDKDRKRDDVLLISKVDDALRVRTARSGEFAF